MLSVIIPTRDRAELLRKALDSLCSQTLPLHEFEVLVIDNGSSDHTKEVCQAFQQTLPLKYFFEPTPGLHIGRHKGMLTANGDILVYADDDIEAFPTWLETIKDCFTDPNVALVGGNNIPNYEHTPPDWLKCLWHKSTVLDGHAIPLLSILELPEGRRPIDPYYIWGCNFSVRKQVLLNAGGFHPDGVPGDLMKLRGDGESYISQYILDNQLSCLFDDKASVLHAVTKERMTKSYFEKQAFKLGVSISYGELRKNSKNKPFSINSLKKLILLIPQKIKLYITQLTASNKELAQLELLMKKGYNDGVKFHRKAYFTDQNVRDWVHKDNYFEDMS